MSLQRRKRFRKRAILPLSSKQKVLKCRKLEKRRTVSAKRRCPSQDALGGHERRRGLSVQPVSPRSSQLSRGRDTDVDVGLNFSTPIKLFESLISPVSPETFFTEYWEKKPLLVKRNGQLASSYDHFFSLDYLNQLVKDRHVVFGRNMNVCRYVNHRRQSLNGSGRVKAEELATLWNEKKATIQFHQPQQFRDLLWRVLTHLETYFGCLVGSNVYITPSDAQGLAPHFDDVEVFILQLEGCKHWRLYSPPIELPQACSKDLSQEKIGTPTHDFMLEAGDLLYFPRGTVHQADTPSHVTHSTHITISTYQHNAWYDFMGHMLDVSLHQAMEKNIIFREGLPLNILGLPRGAQVSSVAERGELLKCKFDSLAAELKRYADIAKSLENFSRDFIASRLPPYSGGCGPQGPIPGLGSSVKLTWPDYTYLPMLMREEEEEEKEEEGRKEEEGDLEQQRMWIVVYHSVANNREGHMVAMGTEPPRATGVKFPYRFKEALELLFARPWDGTCVASLPLSDEDKSTLIITLWAEGLLECTPS